MARKKQTILVVEDDPALLQGLLDLLAFHGYQPTGVAEGKTGLEKALNGPFDLVILDVMLPGLDGFTICRCLRQEKPGQAIMMLTAKGSEDDIVSGLEAGADDYVDKPFSLRELIARIEALLRRTAGAQRSAGFQVSNLFFDPDNLRVEQDGQQVDLTSREMALMAYFQQAGERIVSKQELLEKIWNYQVTDQETRTVDIHIQKLRAKLRVLLGTTPLIVTVRGVGYRLVS